MDLLSFFVKLDLTFCAKVHWLISKIDKVVTIERKTTALWMLFASVIYCFLIGHLESIVTKNDGNILILDTLTILVYSYLSYEAFKEIKNYDVTDTTDSSFINMIMFRLRYFGYIITTTILTFIIVIPTYYTHGFNDYLYKVGFDISTNAGFFFIQYLSLVVVSLNPPAKRESKEEKYENAVLI